MLCGGQPTQEPATPRAARKPSFRRAPGRTQILDEGVRRRGFQPHVSQSVAPGPGNIRAHSGTSGILTSTSHPFPRSTNNVPYRAVPMRPSRVSTCKSSGASQWSNDSSSPTDEGPSSGRQTLDRGLVLVGFVPPSHFMPVIHTRIMCVTSHMCQQETRPTQRPTTINTTKNQMRGHEQQEMETRRHVQPRSRH